MKQQEIASDVVMYCDATNYLLPQFQTNTTIVASFHNGLNLVYNISSHEVSEWTELIILYKTSSVTSLTVAS